MRLRVGEDEMDVQKVTAPQITELLETKENILIFGKSGYGKSSLVKEYAENNGLKLKVINLATKLPEAIGGIPYVTDKGYYTELLSEDLKEVFEDNGENWVIFFDEINQASPEVFNTLYGICHPLGSDRSWAGHSLEKAQIVACGNLSDGTDGTVYLNELPLPLLNRFFVYELLPDKKSATAYLSKKWKNIPQVARYIKELLANHKSPRDIDLCLNVLAYNKSGLLLQAKLGEALTAKIYEIQKGITSIDPADMLKNAKAIRKEFQRSGIVTFGLDTITTEEQLKAKLSEILTEEEVKAVMTDGGED